MAIGSTNVSNLLTGDVLVFCLACDNLSATTPTFDSATGAGAEIGTVTRQVQGARNASAAAGCAFSMWTATMVSDGTSGVVMPTFNLSGAVTARAWSIIALRGASETLRGTVQTANGASTTPQVTSATATTGDVVICGGAFEQNAAVTADSDATNGSWASVTGGFETFSTSGGGSAANMTVTTQTKIVTGSGTQSWDVTSASTDWFVAALVLQPAATGLPPAHIYLGPGVAALRGANW